MKFTYKHTLYASYIGYITQAIVNNLSPLLFLTFHNRFGISLELISVLITLNFGVQIITDISAIKLVEKIRDIKRFSSPEELIAQLEKDSKKATQICKQYIK